MSPRRLERIFDLLAQIQPVQDEHDVVWQGPYYIPRPRMWCPSRFTLYRGTLYVSLHVPPHRQELFWKVGSQDLTVERGFSFGGFSETQWGEALGQIEHRLTSAVMDFAAYNRRVARRLPPGCRTGRIQRRLSWPAGARPPLSSDETGRFRQEMTRAEALPSLAEMSLSVYLDAIAVAYDAVFEDLRSLPPREKYGRRADGRHGGLLDLPPHDSGAFSRWFHGTDWRGAHPWEIVFGHPHGIMVAPHWQPEVGRWRYSLWVDSEGWYAEAARMGLALVAHYLPVDFLDWAKVADALQGVDEVPVGPDLYAVSYEDLAANGPDALTAIAWDPIPQMGPITQDQLARVYAAASPG